MSGKDNEEKKTPALQDIFAQLDEVIEGMEQEDVSLEETLNFIIKAWIC